MNDANVSHHPLVNYHLSVLRSKSTSNAEFRQSVKRLTTLLAYEATGQLKTDTVSVETPLTQCDGAVLSQRIGLVPIIRAGIAMVEPVLDLIPDAEVWHLGMYRNEETAKPVDYYCKLDGAPVDEAFVLDPMLATGGSAEMAIETLKNWGVQSIKMLSLIAAPEGVAHLKQHHTDVPIFACAVDQCLNDNHFIVPGLGDAGDRIFRTLG